MRLDKYEKEALKYAFKNFRGKVYLYGSRVDDTKRGGDIDLLLIPDETITPLKLAIEIQKRFFSRCEQKLDVLIYSEDNAFCREVINHAKRLDIESL